MVEEKRLKIEKAIEKCKLVANGKSIGDVFWGMSEQEKQEMFSMAVDAMGKQLIPRKIEKTDIKVKALDVETNEIWYYMCSPCPACEKWISKIYKYCPYCGQALEVTEDGEKESIQN